MGKQMKLVKVPVGWWDIPENLEEFIKFFRDVLRSIPLEYQASATIELSVTDYGSQGYDKEVVVAYNRPETDEEVADREHLESIRANDLAKREFRLLRELQEKYKSSLSLDKEQPK